MDTHLLAGRIVWGIIALIYVALNIALIVYTAKHKEKITSLVIVSILLTFFISVVSPYVIKPVDTVVKDVVDDASDKVAGMIEQCWPQPEEPAPDQNGETQPPDKSDAASPDYDRVIRQENGRNNLVYHSAIPLENRACAPENSLYPDVTMEMVLSLEAGLPATPGYQGRSRGYAGGVTYAFTAPTSDPEGLYEELKLEVLKNPLVGDMIIRGLAEVYSDFDSKALLKEFLTACNDAFNRSNAPTGMEAWATGYKFPDEQTGFYVTNSYRFYAEALCQFLDTCTNYGVQQFACEAYYDRTSAVTYNALRTKVNPSSSSHSSSSSLPALVLYKTDDSGNVAFAIGFDLDDKDLLIYNPNVIQ